MCALCKLHKRQLVKIIVFYRNSCVSRQRVLDAIEGVDSGTERMFPNWSGIINQTIATLDCDYCTVGRQLARIARENLNTFSPFSVRSLSKLRDANAGGVKRALQCLITMPPPPLPRFPDTYLSLRTYSNVTVP